MTSTAAPWLDHTLAHLRQSASSSTRADVVVGPGIVLTVLPGTALDAPLTTTWAELSAPSEELAGAVSLAGFPTQAAPNRQAHASIEGPLAVAPAAVAVPVALQQRTKESKEN